jgi:GNAT superfamily N-acetyltransferase
MTPRRAGPADAAAIAALVQRAYGAWIPVIGRRPAPMDDDYAAVCAEAEVHALELDGGLAAIMVMAVAADHVWIDNIAVDPACQGRGLGRFWLTFAEAEARRHGLPEVRLCTHERMLANIALYARCGYAETDRRVENGFPRVFMTKRLAA